MLKVYALSTCPYCKKLKKFLNEKELDYECIDLDRVSGEEKEKAVEEVDQLVSKRSFPVTVIGDKVIQGFKPEEIEEALEDESQ